MFKHYLTAVLMAAGLAGNSHAQSLYESMRPAQWNGYIFVSLKMPTATLIALAKESRRALMPLVIAGFDSSGTSIESTREKIQNINSACCGNRGGTKWQIYPQLFDRYKVRQVPSFVLAKGESSDPEDFVKISGDMALADALKRIAQQSSLPEMRQRATFIYDKAFNGN